MYKIVRQLVDMVVDRTMSKVLRKAECLVADMAVAAGHQ
ncbi:hypothetical protein GFS60_07047 (plasmid) [Rhodococcus sp. WAY2]|nr:hypothetical protein GFS60_07047 [Rhodococcus sp. WAY2]